MQFVVLHQDTLAITTGKSGFLDSEAIFAGPMAAVLRNWEGSVDVSLRYISRYRYKN